MIDIQSRISPIAMDINQFTDTKTMCSNSVSNRGLDKSKHNALARARAVL